MKKLFGIFVLFLISSLFLVVLSVISRFQSHPLGLHRNKLLPCSDKPNCVCSEYPENKTYLAPLVVRKDPYDSWQRLKDILGIIGGEIVLDKGDYMHLVFKSRFLRFVDDLELRLDTDEGVIHFRSASRAGYSDLGVNSRRIEKLTALYNGQ